jgi:hypothetical protein
LKSASGLAPSSAENWRMSATRCSSSARRRSSLMSFCTEPSRLASKLEEIRSASCSSPASSDLLSRSRSSAA